MTKDPKDAPGCIDDRIGIFVSPTGKDSNPGTKEAPLKTISAALSLASFAISLGASTIQRVYVCEGTYLEDVSMNVSSMNDGVSMYGGFSCADWSYTGNKPQFGASQLALHLLTDVPVTVEDFLIKAADGVTGAPTSTAALVGSTASVTFVRVNFTAGAGLVGAAGAAGSGYNLVLPSDPKRAGTDASGTTGGAAPSCTSLCYLWEAGSGGPGGSGTTSPTSGGLGSPNMAGGQAGVAGASCSSTGAGGKGGNGTTVGGDATSPTSLGGFAFTGWSATKSDTGLPGSNAQGGGGGGGQSSVSAGGGGSGGCGGCGGGGGGGGQGGGSSMALAVIGTGTVTVTASELHASDAGNGGSGAVGEPGQVGGNGGAGAAPGCNGGAGGTGATGGTGAGGVGGISAGVVYLSAAPTLDAATQNAITFGKAGTKGLGGTPGINDGLDGVAMAVLKSP